MILYAKIAKPKRVHISESKLSVLAEDVFTNKLDRNRKKANITYKKGLTVSANASRAPKEAVKTDKMDSSGSDTYIVPLKGGINSYNITNIDGKEIMHYFKRHFSNEKTNLQIKMNGNVEDYQIEMENSEFNAFLSQFIDKISFVVYDYVSKHKELMDKNEYTFSKICVYPVKSSSNFNIKITELIEKNNQTIFGLPVVKLNENLLKKDTSKMEKDEDFIAKNADYYNSFREKGRKRPHGDETHMNGLNTDINMFKAREKVHELVAQLNNMTDEINSYLSGYMECLMNKDNDGASRYGSILGKMFIEYANMSKASEIKNHTAYQNDYTGEMMYKSNFNGKGNEYIYFEPLFDTQMNKNNYNIIRKLAKIYDPNEYRALGQYVYNVQILKRKPLDFQIKKVFNDTRMGLKNFFSFNLEELEKAKKEIEGNILVIFDDNISGGATLSDICAQFVNIGIKHIIPITFGKMFTQWGGRGPSGRADDWYNLTEPPNGFIFGDNKTFVFNGHSFNTDQITNIMDAANLYQDAFGKYDKEGVNELWNTYKNVKANVGEIVQSSQEKVPQKPKENIKGNQAIRKIDPFKILKIDGKHGFVKYSSPKPLDNNEMRLLLKRVINYLNRELVAVPGARNTIGLRDMARFKFERV